MSRPPFLAPPEGIHVYRLGTSRGEFAVFDARPGVPALGTVLMVPGYTGSKEDFIALLEPLAAAGYRSVAVDGRGQYETPGPRGRAGQHVYRLAALADDVLAQASALAAGPVHLVGHSLGGLVSRGAVLRAADPGALFGSLTLISSGPGRISRTQRWRVGALSGALPVLGSAAVWRLWHPVVDRTETGSFLHRRWLANAPAQLRVTGRTLRWEPDRVVLLAATGLPVHVLTGERDGVWPMPSLNRMAERLGARRTVIRGAEHSPNAQRPQATAGALVDFWSRLTLRR